VDWFRLQYPLYADLCIHFANGGFRLPREAKAFKRMGVVKGVPDLLIAIPVFKSFDVVQHLPKGPKTLIEKKPAHGLFIEMKQCIIDGRPHPRVHKSQFDMINKLRLQGYHAEVCFGCEEAIKLTKNYLKDLKQ